VLAVAFYAAQGAAVWWLWGPLAAALYVVSLPITADVNFHLRPRLARVVRRARVYLRFRGDRTLQARLVEELRALRQEAQAVEALLQGPGTQE
jgi:hypothetical protein